MSRQDGRSTPLRRRPSRTVPALTVGILLLAASVALAWAVIARSIDGTWSTILGGPRDWLVSLTWNSPSIWAVGIVAFVVGSILLLCGLIAGALSALAVRNEGADSATVSSEFTAKAQESETVMTRRAVAHIARAQCSRIDGVSRASATASNNHVHLNVKTSLRETNDLRARVIEEVRERMKTIGLDPVPRITATIDTQG